MLLIRHGATAGNLEGRYIGRTDEPLLDSSREELWRMREEKRFPMPDRVYTSPLLRCRETAKILFPDKTAIVVPAFAECDFGKFEGKNYAELNGHPAYQAFIDSGGELPFPGGESRAEVEARVVRGLEEILRTYEPVRAGDLFTMPETKNFHLSGAYDQNEEFADPPKVLTFVVHGGTILSILHHYLGGSPFTWQIGCGESVFLYQEI